MCIRDRARRESPGSGVTGRRSGRAAPGARAAPLRRWPWQWPCTYPGGMLRPLSYGTGRPSH
eukprot:2482816-Alexandrium_andersonii.AAC.1